jgi:hypothetical protein
MRIGQDFSHQFSFFFEMTSEEARQALSQPNFRLSFPRGWSATKSVPRAMLENPTTMIAQQGARANRLTLDPDRRGIPTRV